MNFMLIAGETSGDLLATELVCAIRSGNVGLEPRFFGAGRQQMAAAGAWKSTRGAHPRHSAPAPSSATMHCSTGTCAHGWGGAGG